MTPGKADQFLPLVRVAAARHHELQESGGASLLAGLIEQESRFDPLAESPTGAAGLGQFTGIGRAEVRRLMKIEEWDDRFSPSPLKTKLADFTRQDAFVPGVAIEAAALFLASLLKKWSYNVEAALTDYNAGGVAARLVAQAGSHAAARRQLESLPSNQRSQSPTYAPEVLARYERFAQSDYAVAGLFDGNYVRT